MAKFREIAKSLVEKALRATGAPTRARSLRHRDTLILCYHNIVPTGLTAVGDISLHLPQQMFARQLDLLTRSYDVVPLENALDPVPVTRSRPRVVITFDDACAGALTAGTDELVQRGLPATFFVTPGMIGAGPYWWDAIRDASGQALQGAARDFILETLQGRNEPAREWAVSKGYTLADVPAHQLAGSETLLQNAVANGMTVASHTWSHPNLAALDEDDCRTELSSARDWLASRFPGFLPWLAYPYGLLSPAVERTVAQSGCTCAVRVEGGWMNGAAEPYRIPRLNVGSGLSLEGFDIRVSGIRVPGMS